MYAEQASMYGNRGDYVNKAIDNYKEAIKADPTAMLSEELPSLRAAAACARRSPTPGRPQAELTLVRTVRWRIFTRLVGDGRLASGRRHASPRHRSIKDTAGA
jgi:hypothetical protein